VIKALLKVHEDKVVRIQATYRGHLTRKALKNGVGLMNKYGMPIKEDRDGEDQDDESLR
jgi:IQ calmodulin-binding motif